jgi:integrase
MGTIRGAGSLRQRRPGVWEIRVALGPDPVTGHSRVRSITVHGDRAAAQEARRHWAATAELLRDAGRPRPAITVAQLLRSWLAADHDWKPSTVSGYRSNVSFLCRDPIGSRRAIDLTPTVLTAICRHWRDTGWHQPTVSNRFRVLRSAMGWAYTMRILDRHPLDGVHGPPQCDSRKDVPIDQVRDLLACTQEQADQLSTRLVRSGRDTARRHRAEQLQLLSRLVADSGARRAELAALRFDDLDGRVLTIARATSNEILGTTKGRRTRRITLGPTTVDLWTDLTNRWRNRCPAGAEFGPWVFSRDPAHTTRLTTSTLGHWDSDACDRAGHPDITLHRLRHTVATALVGQGQVLQAQYRLGHRDASTTLRIYSHALPAADAQAAATIENMLAAGG